MDQTSQSGPPATEQTGPDDRVRAALGVEAGAALPEVSGDTLRAYYKFLAGALPFPFEARLSPDVVPVKEQTGPFTVLHLLEPEDDAEEGLLCAIRMGEKEGIVRMGDLEALTPASREPVADYVRWFLDHGGVHGRERFFGSGGLPLGGWTFGGLIQLAILWGMVCGAMVGGLAVTVEGVTLGTLIGGGAGAVLGAVLGVRFWVALATAGRFQASPGYGGTMGAAAGATVGGVLTAMAFGFVGTIPGSIVGHVLATVVQRIARKRVGRPFWTLWGAWLGGIVLACVMDYDVARVGMLYGAACGALLGVMLLLVVLVSLASLGDRNRE